MSRVVLKAAVSALFAPAMKAQRRRRYWLTVQARILVLTPSDWNLRVVPNKFPALGIEGDLDRQADGMFDKMNGVGAHEVVIETP